MRPRRLIVLLAGAALGFATPLSALPDAAKSLIEQAYAALRRGDGIAAEGKLRRAEEAGALRPDLAAAMGEALIQQGDYQNAGKWLIPAEFSPTQQAYGWRMIALLMRRKDNLSAASDAIDKALTLNPKDPLPWVELGRLRYAQGQELQAIEAARSALAAGPNTVRALEFGAELLRDSDGWAAALVLYEKALKQAPEDLWLLGGYAAALGELGRGQEMLAVTRQMSLLAPSNPYAYFLEAVLAARAGQFAQARSLMDNTRGRLNGQASVQLLNGILELEAGNFNLAIGQFEALLGQQGANPRARLLLARALYQAGRYDDLLKRFAPLAQRADSTPYLLTLIGRAYELTGDRAAAAAFLDRAARSTIPDLLPIPEDAALADLARRWDEAPGSPGLAAPYVRVLLAKGDNAGAARIAGQFLQLRPGSGDALGLLGDTELYQGQGAVAMQHYILASRAHFSEQLLLRMIVAWRRGGKQINPNWLALRYLKAYPASSLAARMVSAQAAFAGNWKLARSLLEKLNRRGGGCDVRVLADLSLAQLRSGDPEAALASAVRAWDLQPSSPVAAQAWGMALVALGRDLALASQLLEQARRIGGDNALLAEARGKLP